MILERAILIAGVLHFGILLASALTPKVLDWRTELRKLDKLTRHLVWVHGAFIVLTIVGFGTLSILFAGPLASGAPLARGLSAFIAIFWGARLAIQLCFFDVRPYVTSLFLKVGYHGLTVVFSYWTIVYTLAAVVR